MKHPRYNYPAEDEISGLDSSTPPANKHARLRICNIYFPYFFQPLMFIQQELLRAPTKPAAWYLLTDNSSACRWHHGFIIPDRFQFFWHRQYGGSDCHVPLFTRLTSIHYCIRCYIPLLD